MSAIRQLSFFPELQDDLHKALDTYKASGVEHLFFQRFVRRLAVSCRSAKPGACIVAACPGGQTLDEAIVKLGEQVRAMDAPHPDSPYAFHPMEISVPTRFTARQLEVELLDRYTQALNSPRISHRGQPRFEDFHLSNYNTRTAIGRLIAFLRTKNPELVIIRDARNLETPDASKQEVRAGWRLIMDIAQQSGIPHIIFAPVNTVSSFIYGDPALLSEVEAVVFKPYHRGEGGEMAAFLGAVNDYNSEIPWAEKDSLASHLEEIDAAVSGDVDRLRQWVVRAISEAIAEPETTRVSWKHFRETTPHTKQRLMAYQDRMKALAMLEFPAESKQDETEQDSAVYEPEELSSDESNATSERKTKPGNRKPRRDRLYRNSMEA